MPFNKKYQVIKNAPKQLDWDEYNGNNWRTGISASYKAEEIDIMSYDRLIPISDYRQFISCRISHGVYNILNIPPAFRYNVLCDFVFLIFFLVRVRNAVWEDII